MSAPLALSLDADLAARVRAAAGKLGDPPEALVLEVLTIVFAEGEASLVGAVLDRQPEK